MGAIRTNTLSNTTDDTLGVVLVTTIYLVFRGAWDDAGPVVAFTTRELAEAHAAELDGAYVEELTLMDRLPSVVGRNAVGPIYEYEPGES